jgi:hypothetical protein
MIQASSIRQRLADPSSSKNNGGGSMLSDNIYMQEEKFQWEDEQPVCSLCAPATDALPNLACDRRAAGGGDRGAGRRSDRRPEEGQRRGQRHRLTIVYTVIVIAVMDDNHK